MWVCRMNIHIHIKKHADMCHTTDKTLPGLSIVVLLSVSHYSCYGSPDFSIIKSFSGLVSVLGFLLDHVVIDVKGTMSCHSILM
jgi:hypothetical protein